MSDVLLSTKVHIPPLHGSLVDRQRLVQRLEDGVAQSGLLALICAPAGYGKTTLLSQWIRRRAMPSSWLSLDSSDNDLTRFLRYFLAAIQHIDPRVGAQLLEMLQPPRPLPGVAICIALINDLAASPKEFTLVLDDYHVIEAQPVHAFLEYLVDHMPGNLHLVLATRADPPLNLPQLRARGRLLELRAADLCFDLAGVRAYYQDILGLPLSEKALHELLQKTEGWVAGLQIAGLMLQNLPDLPQAVQTFTGSNRHILDYLAVEVIERLPPSIQDFLCQTAILDRLEASLCNAVAGRDDSQLILERLDRENQFIVALDDDRRWFRYHRLMADALRRRIERLDPGQLAGLHRRASAWYQGQGLPEPAIQHAFQAADLAHAASLIADCHEEFLKRSQAVTLLGWLKRLPEDQLSQHPRLSLVYAWALLLTGSSPQAVEARLETCAAHPEAASLSAEAAVIRAMLATLTGNASQVLTYAQQAFDDLPASQDFLRSIAAGNLGMAHVMLGDIHSAIQAFKESIALARQSGNIMFAVSSLSNLGGLYLVQGHLKLAEAVYQQALELAATPYGLRLPVACRALLGLSEIAREWNRLDQARQLLEEAILLAQQYNETGELVMLISLARVLQEQGETQKALDLLQKAQALAIQSAGSPLDDRLVDAALARFWLQQGDLTGAAEWAAARGFEQDILSEALPGSSARLIPYDLREAEWLVYTRLLLAQNRTQAALQTLAILLAEAENHHRARRLHEILLLMALAYQAQGAGDLALASLEKSLSQAEPEEYTRVYLDEGPRVASLLRQAAQRGLHKKYCARLLDALQQEQRPPEGSLPAGNTRLVEPLSERELEVLRLLAAGLTNREIGEQLVISLSTVKGHISNICGKLLAGNRTEAVARARQLSIIPD